MFGAVESQKSTGTLHFHGLVFLQRAHQHKTLRDIAEMLEAGLFSVDALKAWHCWVCRETYPDINKQEIDFEKLS